MKEFVEIRGEGGAVVMVFNDPEECRSLTATFTPQIAIRLAAELLQATCCEIG